MDLGKEVYVGLDVHRETIHGTTLYKNGEIICSIDFSNNKEAILEYFKGFYTWNTLIAIEACNFWRGPYKILTEIGYKVKLANPFKCHQIASDKKTDTVDSKILADLLRVGYLPEIDIPTEEILILRDLTRQKIRLTRVCVKMQNSIKACLCRKGISYEGNLWSKEGIAGLNNMQNDEVKSFLRIYEATKKEVTSVKRKIEQIAKLKEETILLETIPGVGYFSAMMIYAEIGNIKRFASVKQLHAYAGVVPGIYQSGTKTRMPKRKNINYWLKWILLQCSGRNSFIKGRSNKFRNYYFKIKKKKGWKTARKAIARKMLSVIWHVLNEKVPYKES